MNKFQQITESKWTYLVIAIIVGYVAAYGYENWLLKKNSDG